MNIGVRIQHHPSRAALIPGLLAALNGFADVEVVTDSGDPTDTWRAHRACLEAMPDNADSLLVIQDDALPVSLFVSKVSGFVSAKPGNLVCLFVPGFNFLRVRMYEAAKRREKFMLFPHCAFLPLVAVVYPRAIVERVLAWSDRSGWPAASSRALRGSDDAVMATFSRSARIHAYCTVPCLVEHGDVVSIARPSHKDGAHRHAALL